VMNESQNLLRKWLIACWPGSLGTLRASPSRAAISALSCDQTLIALRGILIGFIAHAMIALCRRWNRLCV
jgi:hypothetical protein